MFCSRIGFLVLTEGQRLRQRIRKNQYCIAIVYRQELLNFYVAT